MNLKTINVNNTGSILESSILSTINWILGGYYSPDGRFVSNAACMYTEKIQIKNYTGLYFKRNEEPVCILYDDNDNIVSVVNYTGYCIFSNYPTATQFIMSGMLYNMSYIKLYQSIDSLNLLSYDQHFKNLYNFLGQEYPLTPFGYYTKWTDGHLESATTDSNGYLVRYIPGMLVKFTGIENTWNTFAYNDYPTTENYSKTFLFYGISESEEGFLSYRTDVRYLLISWRANISLDDDYIIYENALPDIIDNVYDKIKSKDQYSQYLFKLSDNYQIDEIVQTNWTYSNNKWTNNDIGKNSMFVFQRAYAIDSICFMLDFTVLTTNTKICAGMKVIKNSEMDYVEIDFQNLEMTLYNYNDSELNNSNISLSGSYINKRFRIVITTIDRNIHAKLFDLNSYEQLSEIISDCWVNTRAAFNDFPTVYCLSGNIEINDLIINCEKDMKNVLLYITGDSITEGDGILLNKDRWTTLVSNHFTNGRVIVSGRSGGVADDLYRRLYSEAEILKPKYIMVTIGTNGGNSVTALTNIINKILEIGSIPIINHIPADTNNRYIGYNSTIDEAIALFDTKILCCKFDLATSINYDISQGYNSSLFVNGNSVHPNESGCLKMYQRVKIDCPELFDSLI